MRATASTIAVLACAGAALAQPCEVVLATDATSISDSPGSPFNPDAAYNGEADEYMVVWSENAEIFGVLVDAAGQPIGSSFPIMVRGSAQVDPAVAHSMADDRYFVAWRTQESGFFNKSRGRILNADGSFFGDDFFVGEGFEQDIGYNAADGEFFQTGRQFPGGGIFAQRVDGAGSLLGGSLLIDGAGAPAPNGELAYDPVNNRFLATYRNQDARDLRGRIINGDGSFATDPFVISSIFPASGTAAAVAFDPGQERYLVVFGDFNGPLLRGQFVTADGDLDGDTFEIFDTGSDQTNAVLGFDPDEGAYLVAWRDGNSIATLAIAADGTIGGPPTVFANGTAGATPTLAPNTQSGGFLVAWPDTRLGASTMFARVVELACGGGCPADLDGDGDADVSDFFTYLDLFATGDPRADFTGDGSIDVSDFFAYLDAFARGC